MTEREGVLLKILILTIIFASYFVCFQIWKTRLESLDNQIERYTRASEKIETKKNQTEKVVKEEYKKVSCEEAGKALFEDLSGCGITPEKYQFIENKRIEISFKTTSKKIISFLLNKENGEKPYTVTSISIKPVEEAVQVYMKVEPVYSERKQSTLTDEKLKNIETLFHEKRITQTKAEPVQIVKEVEKEEDALTCFDFVGKAVNSSVETEIVFKSKETERVLKTVVKSMEGQMIFNLN